MKSFSACDEILDPQKKWCIQNLTETPPRSKWNIGDKIYIIPYLYFRKINITYES